MKEKKKNRWGGWDSSVEETATISHHLSFKLSALMNYSSRLPSKKTKPNANKVRIIGQETKGKKNSIC